MFTLVVLHALRVQRILVSLASLLLAFHVAAVVSVSVTAAAAAAPPAPAPGTVLYQLPVWSVMNVTNSSNFITSLSAGVVTVTDATRTSSTVSVCSSNYDPAVYCLPYPALSPVTALQAHNLSVLAVAVQPITGYVWFAAQITSGGTDDSEAHRHSVGYFWPNGSVAAAYNRTLLGSCWSLMFSPDGSYLYYGSVQTADVDSVIQINSTDGSFVRALTCDPATDGPARAIAVDEQHRVIVLRAGVQNGNHSNGTLTLYSNSSHSTQQPERRVMLDLRPLPGVEFDTCVGDMAWHAGLLYVADGGRVRVINGSLLRDSGVVQIVFEFNQGNMQAAIHLAILPDSTVVVSDDITATVLFMQGLQTSNTTGDGGSSSSSSTSPPPTALSSSSSSTSSTSSSSSSSSSSPSSSSSSSSSVIWTPLSGAPTSSSTYTSYSASGSAAPCPIDTGSSGSSVGVLVLAGAVIAALLCGVVIGVGLTVWSKRHKSAAADTDGQLTAAMLMDK